MKAGKHLKGLRDRKDYTQENVATDLHISKPLASHLENDRRNMTEEMAKQSVAIFNDAQYGYEIAHETARDYITPLATANKAIEWHRLALEEALKREAIEAVEHFNNVSLAKHPDFITDDELAEIEIGVDEFLDVGVMMKSFLAHLEQVYPISIKERMRKRTPTWKAGGWIV